MFSKDNVVQDGNGTDGTASVLARALVAGIGGAVAAMGWLPIHLPIVLIGGLALVFYLCHQAKTAKEVSIVGFLGALVFFIAINRSLVSAYGWGGWSDAGGMSVGSASWWLLNGLWLLASVWEALFWVVVFFVYWKLRAEAVWVRVLATASAWIGIAEWLRSLSHWDFEWGFLGVALADVAALRQWASIFGVLFLSGMMVSASLLIVEFVNGKLRSRLVLAGVGLGMASVLWFGGERIAPRVDARAVLHDVAAFQFSPPVPPAGTTLLGISDLWLTSLPQIVAKNYELIVLPESISSQAIELDSVAAPRLAPKRQVVIDKWEQVFASILQKYPQTFIAMGTETVEQGKVFNTTSVWGKGGLLGRQHKIHLVPFAEYLPGGWGFMGTQAVTYYEQGKAYLPIKAGDFQIGSFICQEVQQADTARSLVRNGANILVSGGNDGVFADHRVAQIHHSMAKIRATETGRYLVRAMKSGISSIIAPDGEVLGVSPGSGAALVSNKVALLKKENLWVRMGNGLILLFAFGFLGFVFVLRRR